MKSTKYVQAFLLAVALQFAQLGISNPSDAADEMVRIYHEVAKLHPLGRHHIAAEKMQPIKGSKAILLITKEGANVSLSTRQLAPGHIYTWWFIVFNNPEKCEAKPCNIKDFLNRADETMADAGYADVTMADDKGEAQLSTYVPKGPLKQAWYGNGLQNLKSAEIHMALHDHGKLLPEMAETMMMTYRGGCTTESLYPDFPEISKSFGEPGPNKCNLLQVVVFVQDSH